VVCIDRRYGVWTKPLARADATHNLARPGTVANPVRTRRKGKGDVPPDAERTW